MTQQEIQNKLIARYGDPFKDQLAFEKKHMTLLNYPGDIDIAIPALGKSVYCNRDFVEPYLKVLRLLMQRGLHKEIKSNDQCFNVRKIRGSETLYSAHSWGLAIDLNPDQNPLGMTRLEAIQNGLTPFTENFQQTFRDCDFTTGITFPRGDGMHFEYVQPLLT